MKIYVKQLVTDIRVWIFLFMIVRLVGINNPPLDTAHSWRQITGNMVARNFLEVDANILYPRVDMAGDKCGITGTEFPLLNYIIYLLSLLFGWNHWIGRLVVLITSAFGSWYFYKIVNRFWKESIAFNATFILLISNWFIYARKIMPDTFSVSLCLIGVYYILLFFEHRKWYSILVGSFLILLGGLSKIPALLVVAPLGLMLFDNRIRLKTKKLFIFAMFLLIIPIVWWYFYWVPYLVIKYEYWHYYMGTSFQNGLIELGQNVKDSAEKFYFDALKYSGFGLFVWGLYLIFKGDKKDGRLLKWIFLIESFFFVVFMIKAGRNFWVHSYYIIPFIPIMALVASYGLSYFSSKKWQLALLTLVVVEGFANQQHDFRINSKEKSRLDYELWADSFSKRSDLFVIDGGDNPKDLYFTHRKGWTISPKEAIDNHYIDSLTSMGANFLWINKTDNFSNNIRKKVVFENNQCIVFQLR